MSTTQINDSTINNSKKYIVFLVNFIAHKMY